MKFSIITPVLNRESTISCTISSVICQTYTDLEHIIIDGGSIDKTLSIINENLHPKITLISDNDQGIYDAINKGISRSRGDIIGILHSDDYYYDNSVLADVAASFENPYVDIVYGDILYVDKNHKVVRKWTAGKFQPDSIKFGWITPHCATFVRSSTCSRIGPYSTKYSISSDYDWLIRLFKRHTLAVYLPRNLIVMRLGGISNKSLPSIIDKSIQDLKIINAHRLPGIITLIIKNIRKIPQFFN